MKMNVSATGSANPNLLHITPSEPVQINAVPISGDTASDPSVQVVSVDDKKKVEEMERITRAMQGPNVSLQISVHDKLNAIMIKVYDKDNGNLIREIPPEKTLDAVAKMLENAGILVDKKV